MRLFLRVVFAIGCSGYFLAAFAQDTTTVRSGFAVVTVVSGNIGGLIATETLKNQTTSGSEQAIVAPSPLITSASILVPPGLETTGIAMANPSSGAGGVNMVLTDSTGGVVSSATIVLSPRGQLSRYLNEIFAASSATPLLLTVSSEIPFAMLILHFNDTDFTPVPLTSLSTPTPVPVQPLTVSPVPATINSGFAIAGITPAIIFPSTTFPSTTFPSATFTTPAPTATIGGGTSFIFPQVAAGGDWASDIAIGNSSAALQSVRIDFFNPDGSISRSLTDIDIQPRGVVFFSNDSNGATIR